MTTRQIAALGGIVRILVLFFIGPQALFGQAVGSVEIRPFVTGLSPVVGRGGAVGGIAIDANGVVQRSTAADASQLREARLAALTPVESSVAAATRSRKISLRGLQDALRQRRERSGHFDDELQNLAGLTRAECVFADPENHDIVIVGPAEGWLIDQRGQAIGRTSGRPPVQLDDLIVALRTARAATSGRGISCSIDPTEEGLRKLQPLLSAARGLNDAAVSRLEQALGDQQITITGVPPDSHFAHVLVAADFSMKCLGMNLQPSPVKDLPSYLELLQAPSAPRPKNSMPRWWMAPRYEPLLRDESGLAWQLRGSGVQTLAEAGYLRSAESDRAERDDLLARKWAEAMTLHFESLARAMPAFAELRNCMDLAVIAALLTKEDLPAKTGCDLSLLLDQQQIAVGEYDVPVKVASRASFVRKGGGWILSLSGGVQVDSWFVLQRVETSADLDKQQHEALINRRHHWWWD